MAKIQVNIVNESKNAIPQYESALAAGMDVRAAIEAPVGIKPMERKLIPTGIRLQLPDGYECQVRPRSGLALKRGLTVINTPGTVDCDFRGIIGVILINLSDELQVIEPGDRIAQLVFNKVERAELTVVETLEETERGDGGFGHSGIK